jgi:hypothetical protein
MCPGRSLAALLRSVVASDEWQSVIEVFLAEAVEVSPGADREDIVIRR